MAVTLGVMALAFSQAITTVAGEVTVGWVQGNGPAG